MALSGSRKAKTEQIKLKIERLRAKPLQTPEDMAEIKQLEERLKKLMPKKKGRK